MTDIAKCRGINCPLKYHCWRFLAPQHGGHQSYLFSPIEDGECEYFWPIDPEPEAA